MRGESISRLALHILGFILILGSSNISTPAATVIYNLYATDGYVEMADGMPVYIYGFIGGREGVDLTYQTSYCIGDGVIRTCGTPENVLLAGGPAAPIPGPLTEQETDLAGNAQFPGPIIYAAVGDRIVIRFKNLGVLAQPNAPDEARSLYFHGLDMPENPAAADPEEVIVYTLTPDRAGTYMYSSHVDAVVQAGMGLIGALVVYDPDDPASAAGPGQGFGGTLYGAAYDRDYVLLLSELDLRGHADEEGTYGGLVPINSWDPNPFNWALYRPQFWHINGLSYPNTTHNDFASAYTFAEWMAAHPGYDPLISGSVSALSPSWGTQGEKVLLRLINAGFQTHSIHMHGYHGLVIGSNQRAADRRFEPKTKKPGINPSWEGSETNTLTIGSGETYAWLIDLGKTPGPAGQEFPLHNRDHTTNTNDGWYLGGMYTVIMPTP